MRKVCKEASEWIESEGACVNVWDVKDRELLGKQVRDVLGDEYMAELLQCDVLPKGKVELLRNKLVAAIRLNSADRDRDARVIANEVEDAVNEGNVKSDKDKIWIGFDEDSGELLWLYLKDYTKQKEKLKVAKRVLDMINSFRCD